MRRPRCFCCGNRTPSIRSSKLPRSVPTAQQYRKVGRVVPAHNIDHDRSVARGRRSNAHRGGCALTCGIWGQAQCGVKCHQRATIQLQALAQTRARDDLTAPCLAVQVLRFRSCGSSLAIQASNQNCACSELPTTFKAPKVGLQNGISSSVWLFRPVGLIRAPLQKRSSFYGKHC